MLPCQTWKNVCIPETGTHTQVSYPTRAFVRVRPWSSSQPLSFLFARLNMLTLDSSLTLPSDPSPYLVGFKHGMDPTQLTRVSRTLRWYCQSLWFSSSQCFLHFLCIRVPITMKILCDDMGSLVSSLEWPALGSSCPRHTLLLWTQCWFPKLLWYIQMCGFIPGILAALGRNFSQWGQFVGGNALGSKELDLTDMANWL